jgi:predicted metalloprotease
MTPAFYIELLPTYFVHITNPTKGISMRWQMARRSGNVQNLRGKGYAAGGGGMFLMALAVYFLGGDPMPYLMEGVNRSVQNHSASTALDPAAENEQVDFVSAVLGSTEDVWASQFTAHGTSYDPPHLTLFTGGIMSACGSASAATGPFYCPNDSTIYLDLNFFQQLETQLDAPGDFARAYVIAHEVGHHVQHMTGQLKNGSSVAIELQADCLSGVWAHDAGTKFDLLEPGEVDEALNAASQIGDDILQKRQQGYVVPDSFTHGSAAQRNAAFRKGYNSGQIEACGL